MYKSKYHEVVDNLLFLDKLNHVQEIVNNGYILNQEQSKIMRERIKEMWGSTEKSEVVKSLLKNGYVLHNEEIVTYTINNLIFNEMLMLEKELYDIRSAGTKNKISKVVSDEEFDALVKTQISLRKSDKDLMILLKEKLILELKKQIQTNSKARYDYSSEENMLNEFILIGVTFLLKNNSLIDFKDSITTSDCESLMYDLKILETNYEKINVIINEEKKEIISKPIINEAASNASGNGYTETIRYLIENGTPTLPEMIEDELHSSSSDFMVEALIKNDDDIEKNSWDVSNVRSMQDMFLSLKKGPSISDFNIKVAFEQTVDARNCHSELSEDFIKVKSIYKILIGLLKEKLDFTSQIALEVEDIDSIDMLEKNIEKCFKEEKFLSEDEKKLLILIRDTRLPAIIDIIKTMSVEEMNNSNSENRTASEILKGIMSNFNEVTSKILTRVNVSKIRNLSVNANYSEDLKVTKIK